MCFVPSLRAERSNPVLFDWRFKERKGAPYQSSGSEDWAIKLAAAPFCFFEIVEEDFKLSVLGRPGSDLLSQVLRHSTIGAKAFDGRVRDGIGSDHLAKATRPAKDRSFVEVNELVFGFRISMLDGH